MKIYIFSTHILLPVVDCCFQHQLCLAGIFNMHRFSHGEQIPKHNINNIGVIRSLNNIKIHNLWATIK